MLNQIKSRNENFVVKMNYPAASCEISEECKGNYLKGVTPNVFIGGPVPDSPGFPLKTCGNDGLRKGNQANAAKLRGV